MDWLLSALLILAGVFGLVGSWGLIRLRDAMQRLHAPTAAATLGLGAALVASMLHSWFHDGVVSWQELLVTIFLLLSAPITANFLAKVHIHQRLAPRDLPDPGTGNDWATFAADPPRE